MKAVYLTTDGDTTTVLPFPIEAHNYGCGVIEMNGKLFVPKDRNNQDNNRKDNNENLYLCCNMVEDSFVGNIKMPVLRTIKRKNGVVSGIIHKVIWLKVMRPTISNIRLYITDEKGNIVSLNRNKLNCTLLFVKDPRAE